MSDPTARVKAANKKKPNLLCFFTGATGANYSFIIDTPSTVLAVFICEKVVNLVREVGVEGSRIKGVSMANYNEREASLLEVSRGGQTGRCHAKETTSRLGGTLLSHSHLCNRV